MRKKKTRHFSRTAAALNLGAGGKCVWDGSLWFWHLNIPNPSQGGPQMDASEGRKRRIHSTVSCAIYERPSLLRHITFFVK
jgi:hypothetical protein